MMSLQWFRSPFSHQLFQWSLRCRPGTPVLCPLVFCSASLFHRLSVEDVGQDSAAQIFPKYWLELLKCHLAFELSVLVLLHESHIMHEVLASLPLYRAYHRKAFTYCSWETGICLALQHLSSSAILGYICFGMCPNKIIVLVLFNISLITQTILWSLHVREHKMSVLASHLV